MRPPKSGYYPALDGLRAVAVLLVASWHVQDNGTFNFLEGGFGVRVFFVLSGFLITGLLLREEKLAGRVDLRAFYIRRAFRILPLYYLVLCTYIVLIFVLHVDDRAATFGHALPYYLTYLQEVPHFTFDAPRGIPFEIAWSLGIEEKFYLIWPFVAFTLTRSHLRRLVVAILTVFCAFAAVALGPGGRLIAPYAFIAAGCVLALLVDRQPRVQSLLSSHWVSTTGIVLCFVAPGFAGGVLVLIGSCLALPGLLLPSTGLPRLLASAPFAYIGRISYGFYLTHQLGLHAARMVLPSLSTRAHDSAVLVLGTALTLVAATVLHRWVETPLIAMGRKLAVRAPRPS